MSEHTRTVSRRAMLESLGAAGALTLAGCTQSQDDGGDGGLSGEVEIAGSSTVFPLATAMKESFQEDHSGVSIPIQSTGSGGGFQNHFCPGDVDLNNASRPIAGDEEQLCSDNGVDPIEFTVATDAVTVIVHDDAEWIDCITVDELAQIWGPDDPPSTWSEVNSEWPDETIELFGPTDASGTFDYFTETVIGEAGSHRTDYSATEQDRQIVQGVQNNEYAMGYMGFAYYSQNTDAVKALGVDDGSGCVEPSLEAASSGEYSPLSRPLFTYAASEALGDEAVAEFLQFWLENASSEELVANQVGYVPLTDSTQQEMQDRLDSAIQEAG